MTVTIETATNIEPYHAATIKTWPAKYETHTTETENSVKTQAFPALTTVAAIAKLDHTILSKNNDQFTIPRDVGGQVYDGGNADGSDFL